MRGEPYVARLGTGLRRPRSAIPGRDVAGRIEALGEGVSGFEPGQEVFGWCEGAFAEYAAVPAAQLQQKPSNVTLEEAAAVPTCGFTALQGLRDKGELRAGRRVLVVGASGGVGTFAVQIAKALGAEVTGVCSAANAELVVSLGADRVIDYATEDFAAAGPRYEVILDLVGNRSLGELRRALVSDGALVMVGGSGGRWLKGTGRFMRGLVLSPFTRQRLRPLIHRANGDDLATLRAMVEAESIAPVIDSSYPLTAIVEAVAHFEPGHGRGKVIVSVG